MRRFFYVLIVVLLAPTAAFAQAPVDIDTYLSEIEAMCEQVVTLSEEASKAASVDAIKDHSDEVFALIWGQSASGDGSSNGAVAIHGWKTRWQVDNGHFDEAFAARYGVVPPEIQDTRELGIMGRGRAVRRALQEVADNDDVAEAERMRAERVIASLNNVIGWMKMDDGVTKGERQPRVDLTREWDSPSAFWLSTADTGWLPEVFSQSINIMKVDYQDDVNEARSHAKSMHDLAMKVMDGVDANGDGTVSAEKMEGGIRAALAEARSGGLVETTME